MPHISTGDILRQAVRDETPLGREVAATIASGALVSDELISSLVKARLDCADTAGGFLLDGFPRTVGQARLLDECAVQSRSSCTSPSPTRRSSAGSARAGSASRAA